MFDDLREPTEDQPEGGDDSPDWLTELSDDAPASDPLIADAAIPSFDDEPRFGDDPLFEGDLPTPQAARGGDGMTFGMTAQQRAVLSVFLFLDVSVLGCVLLLAAEKIAIP
jgi:hypothetical protein